LTASGSPLQNLEKKNFQLSDDGVPQAITNFGTGEAPMTICMLIEFANRFWRFLVIALRYSYSFLEVIHPKDWVAVVSFDMKPEILTDFTQDRSEVRAGLDQLRIPGFSESNLYDALAYVLDRMKEVHGRKAVVAVVTGIDTFSKLTYDQCLKIVRASDTPIYPISIMEFMTRSQPQRRQHHDSCRPKMRSKPWPPTPAVRRISRASSRKCRAITSKSRSSFACNTAWASFPPTRPKTASSTSSRLTVVDDQGNPLTIFNEKGKKVKYHIVARDGYYAPKS
jgi:Ca-activated chloride channel homolog